MQLFAFMAMNPDRHVNAHRDQWRTLIDGDTVRTTPTPERGDYPAFYAAMRDAILGEAPPPVPADQALTVMRILDAGLRSAAERREIAL